MHKMKCYGSGRPDSDPDVDMNTVDLSATQNMAMAPACNLHDANSTRSLRALR